MLENGFSLTCNLPYKDTIFNFVLVQENMSLENYRSFGIIYVVHYTDQQFFQNVTKQWAHTSGLSFRAKSENKVHFAQSNQVFFCTMMLFYSKQTKIFSHYKGPGNNILYNTLKTFLLKLE